MTHIEALEIVLKRVTQQLEMVPANGQVRPSPQYFSKAADFWNTVTPSVETRNQVEEPLINATWVYPVNFITDPTSGQLGNPDRTFFFEIYRFTQYGNIRVDQTSTPDVYNSRVLSQWMLFLEGWLGTMEKFGRKNNIPGLDGYAIKSTQPIQQFADMGSTKMCQYISGVVGYDIRFRLTVNLSNCS